jgi:hypothetical protein
MNGRVFRVAIYDIFYPQQTIAAEPVTSDPLAEPVAAEPLECVVCKKKFEKKYRLNAHLKENHINPKAKCDICGKSYTRKSSLKLHTIKKHINKSPVIPESFDETS